MEGSNISAAAAKSAVVKLFSSGSLFMIGRPFTLLT